MQIAVDDDDKNKNLGVNGANAAKKPPSPKMQRKAPSGNSKKLDGDSNEPVHFYGPINNAFNPCMSLLATESESAVEEEIKQIGLSSGKLPKNGVKLRPQK